MVVANVCDVTCLKIKTVLFFRARTDSTAASRAAVSSRSFAAAEVKLSMGRGMEVRMRIRDIENEGPHKGDVIVRAHAYRSR